MNKTKKKDLKRIKVLIIGYGSIGRKHLQVLQSMGIKYIYVYSKQKKIPFIRINNLSEIKKINPDYIVVASNTSDHFSQLKFIEKNLKNKLILVEKPIFSKFKKLKIKNNKVFVGYNLRLHPAISLIKNKIKNRKIWYASATCGSYLPKWRNNRHYSLTHSAKKSSGGGVLLELSHELDYFLWLFKEFKIQYVYNKKISNLKINTDDILDLKGNNSKIKYLNIKLNYFFRQPVRKISIEGLDISIHADLIKNSVFMIEKNKERKYFWPHFKSFNLYKKQHENILNKSSNNLCSYKDSLKVMKLIKQIKNIKSN